MRVRDRAEITFSEVFRGAGAVDMSIAARARLIDERGTAYELAEHVLAPGELARLVRDGAMSIEEQR